MGRNPIFYDRFETGEIQAALRKIEWKPVLTGLSLILLFVEIMAFGLGIFSIMSGWHSLDLSQDVRALTLELGADPANISECNLGGECFDLQTTYLSGGRTMFSGIKLTIAMSMMITATLILIFTISMRWKK
jgi:energy-coupling factor transporter transmembrane protein EcfT